MQIREILGMKGGAIFGIGPQGRLADAVDLMVTNDIGSLVVLEGGAMIGMLTFREVLQALKERHGNLGEARVAEVMQRDPVTGTPADSVDQARTVMTQQHVRYLPILEEGRLLGVISFHDIAKAALQQASFENKLLKRYIRHWPDDEGRVS
jgi:CBS domain-containing protein